MVGGIGWVHITVILIAGAMKCTETKLSTLEVDMADVLTAGNAPALNTNSLFAPFRNVFAWAVAAYKEYRLMNELHKLDDRLLDDIGLSRPDLSGWHRTGVHPTH